MNFSQGRKLAAVLLPVPGRKLDRDVSVFGQIFGLEVRMPLQPELSRERAVAAAEVVDSSTDRRQKFDLTSLQMSGDVVETHERRSGRPRPDDGLADGRQVHFPGRLEKGEGHVMGLLRQGRVAQV